MPLFETLQQTDLSPLPPAVPLTDQQTLDALNVIVVIRTDHVLHQWTFIRESLIMQGIAPAIVYGASRILSALGDAGVALCESIAAGIDLASPLTIASIQSQNITTPPEAALIINGLLAIGTTYGHRWQLPANGIETQPTLIQIAETRQEIVNRRQGNYIQQQYLNAAFSSGLSKQQIQTIVASDASWGE